MGEQSSPFTSASAKPYRILFICTANQCRSPVAEALFRNRLAEMESAPDDRKWMVESAGTWAAPDQRLHPGMRTATRALGLRISGHRSRDVEDVQPLDRFHLIVTMEAGHKESLSVEFPDVAKRIYLLTELSGLAYDVPDPVTGDGEDFRASVRELDRLICRGFERIIALAQQYDHAVYPEL